MYHCVNNIKDVENSPNNMCNSKNPISYNFKIHWDRKQVWPKKNKMFMQLVIYCFANIQIQLLIGYFLISQIHSKQ